MNKKLDEGLSHMDLENRVEPIVHFDEYVPKMGESVAEATIIKWLKEEGETVELEEPVLEIATDKVDSEVPSEVNGVLKEILFHVDDVVNVGETLAIIETDSEYDNDEEIPESYSNEVNENDSQVEADSA